MQIHPAITIFVLSMSFLGCLGSCPPHSYSCPSHNGKGIQCCQEGTTCYNTTINSVNKGVCCSPIYVPCQLYNGKFSCCIRETFPRAEDNWAALHKRTIEAAYDAAIYPNSFQIIRSGLIPDVFAENVTGRVSPIGFFNTTEDVSEYFYGILGSNPATPFRFVGYDFAYFANNGLTSVSTINLSFLNNLTGEVTNITQDGYWEFDKEGRIERFDLVDRNLGLWMIESGVNNYTDPAVRQQTIGEICQTHELFCNDENEQYNSTEACIEFLSSIDYGTPDQIWSNTTICRFIHVLLVPFRPEVHCPHIGPSGGGECVPVDYDRISRLFIRATKTDYCP